MAAQPRKKRDVPDIQSDLDAVEGNAELADEANFAARAEAVDFIEFNVIERIDGLLEQGQSQADLLPLKQRAERIKRRLDDIDEALFDRLRKDIRGGGLRGSALKDLIRGYTQSDADDGAQPDEIGYDSLDTFINGLLHAQAIPMETLPLEPGMVFYQKTPARIILEIVEQGRLTEADVFYDLGSGLGQVPILVHLLSGAAAKGVEFEPAYCDYARTCAADLEVSGVEFIQADARRADYAAGTVYFLYTPFNGEILAEVLEKLRRESRKPIRIFTYGPCTAEVTRVAWLRRLDPHGDDIHKLGEFAGL